MSSLLPLPPVPAALQDRSEREQRELALNICTRYELDPLLKHLVMIEGRPYITRDGLLHVAHRSGKLDGIETTPAQVVDGFWQSTCSVYRKDMSRPFTYVGRYPTTGGNAKFAPEMAVKVGEVMALRRAFDVAAPVAEERWDLPEAVTTSEPVRIPSIAERAAQRAQEAVVIDDPEPITAPAGSSSPVEAPAPPAPPTGAGGACPVHDKPWRRNSRGAYCATKLADGTWCAEQPS